MPPAVVDAAVARRFAEAWIAAWNSHDLDRMYAGIGSIAIHDLSIDRRIAIEVVELGADGKVTRGSAHHGPAAG